MRKLSGLILVPLLMSCASATGSLQDVVAPGWIVEPAESVSPPVMIGRMPSRDGDSPVLIAYIEGDGRAWYRKSIPPENPTPRNPLGLKLAMATPDDYPVAYLARPCQYLPEPSSACRPSLWTLERYGEASINAMGSALDRVKSSPRQRVVLVGYSGGGVVAALLAAERDDVIGLVTVASNLDIDLWAEIHGVTPLSGSLNPVNFANALVEVPQLHFSGAQDRVVPAVVVDSYLEKVGLEGDEHHVMVEHLDHGCCWEAEWPGLFRRAVTQLENQR